jgi:hypothetical protein
MKPLEPPDMNSEETGSKSFGHIWLWVFICIGVYVFSVGPVNGIYERTKPHSRATDEALQTVYAPIIALKDTPLFAPLEAWADMWEKLLKPKAKSGQGT